VLNVISRSPAEKAQARYADAEPLYKRSLAIREKELGPNHLDIGRSLNSLAVLYQAQARYADAEPLYKRVFRYADAESLYKRSRRLNRSPQGG
jgi:tetratricopeptide (TPR) repeat protein